MYDIYIYTYIHIYGICAPFVVCGVAVSNLLSNPQHAVHDRVEGCVRLGAPYAEGLRVNPLAISLAHGRVSRPVAL